MNVWIRYLDFPFQLPELGNWSGSSLKRLFFATVIFLLVLVGCGSQESIRSAIKEQLPEDAETFTREFITLVREGRTEEYEQRIGEPLKTSEGLQSIRMLQGLLRAGDVKTSEIINFRKAVSFSGNLTRYSLEYHVQYKVPDISAVKADSEPWTDLIKGDEQDHVLHQIITITADEGPTRHSVVGFYVKMIPASVKEIHSLSLEKMDISRQAFLTFWILVPLFSLYTAVLCLRSKVSWKLLWFLFIILGVGQLTLNFTTGQLMTRPFSIQLLGASFFRMGVYGPWLFSVSWPLGAVLFYFRRNKMKKGSSKSLHESGSITLDQGNQRLPDENADANEESRQQELEF